MIGLSSYTGLRLASISASRAACEHVDKVCACHVHTRQKLDRLEIHTARNHGSWGILRSCCSSGSPDHWTYQNTFTRVCIARGQSRKRWPHYWVGKKYCNASDFLRGGHLAFMERLCFLEGGQPLRISPDISSFPWKHSDEIGTPITFVTYIVSCMQTGRMKCSNHCDIGVQLLVTCTHVVCTCAKRFR